MVPERDKCLEGRLMLILLGSTANLQPAICYLLVVKGFSLQFRFKTFTMANYYSSY